MSVHEQYFGAISKESQDFSDVPFIGIVGTAFGELISVYIHICVFRHGFQLDICVTQADLYGTIDSGASSQRCNF